MRFKLKDELKKVYEKSFLFRSQIVGLIVGTILFFFSYSLMNYKMISHIEKNFFSIYFFSIINSIYKPLVAPFMVFASSNQSGALIYPLGNLIGFFLIHLIEFMIIFTIVHLIKKKFKRIKLLSEAIIIIFLFIISRIIFLFFTGPLLIFIFFGGLT